MNKKNTDVIFFRVGILFAVIGLVFIGLSVFYMISYDKVEGSLYVSSNKRKHADITYEYDGKLYENIGLSSYNFRMRNGKVYTVYINPDKPEIPKCTNFAMGTLCLMMGGWLIKVGTPVRKSKKEEILWRD